MFAAPLTARAILTASLAAGTVFTRPALFTLFAILTLFAGLRFVAARLIAFITAACAALIAFLAARALLALIPAPRSTLLAARTLPAISIIISAARAALLTARALLTLRAIFTLPTALRAAAIIISRLLKELLAVQADSALTVDIRDDDLDLIAKVEEILNVLDIIPRHIGDMQQAVGARSDLEEDAVALHAAHGAGIFGADLRLRRQALDDRDGLLHGLGVGRSDRHGAVVAHVDLHARLIDDRLDHLSARSDDEADLIRLHLQRRDARRVPIELGARRVEDLIHLTEDMEAAFARLLERLVKDRG